MVEIFNFLSFGRKKRKNTIYRSFKIFDLETKILGQRRNAISPVVGLTKQLKNKTKMFSNLINLKSISFDSKIYKNIPAFYLLFGGFVIFC